MALNIPWWLNGKESACNVGDLGLIPGLGRSPGEGNSDPLQYSGLENSMDRGVWQATIHGVAKNGTQLSHTHTHTYTHSTSFPGGSVVKNLPANAGESGLIPGSGKILWSMKWQPTPVLLPGKSQTEEPDQLQSMGLQESQTQLGN